MLKLRSSALAAAVLLLLVHGALLVFRYGTDAASLWGDVIGIAAIFLAAFSCWSAVRRSGPFGKRVWRLVFFSLILALLGQIVYTYYFDYLHSPASTLWPSDILVFFWVVPAMMTLFLGPRDPNSGFGWLRFCDFVQVCALVLALELCLLYTPSRWETAERAMAVRAFHMGLAFFGLLALSFLVRGALSLYQVSRAIFLRLAVFFFAYAITTNTTLYAFANGNVQQGIWMDLLWTATYCVLVVIAVTWDGAEPEPVTIVPFAPGMQLLSQFTPLLIPAIVFPLVLSIAQEQFFWSLVLVLVSFAAASGRLFVVQHQLMVSSRESQKNLALLQGIMEGTADAVFVKDPQGRYLMINPAGARFLGRTIDDVVGKDDTELFTPEVGRHIMECDRDVMRRGESQTYEETATAAGVTRTYLATKGPYRGPNGQVIGLLGICSDISDRKRAEEEIQRNLALLQGIMEGSPDAIFVKDLEGRYVMVNSAGARYLGRTADEVIGKDDVEMFGPVVGSEIRERDRIVLQSGETGTFEQVFNLAGVTRTFLTTKGPFRDASGRAIGVLGVSRDFTDRKQAEEEVRRSQQKLSIHFEHTPLAVVEWDMEFRVAAWNPSAERIFGYSREEAIGQHASFIVPSQFREHVAKVWQELVRQRAGVRSTNDNITKEGRTISCEWYNTPLVDESGQMLGAASLAQDVTERVALEERLRQSQKMEAVGRLAGGVAHDFNNLLTVILGYSQILADGVPSGSRLSESTAQIKSAADRAAGITRQLLAFSRKAVLSPRVINLNDIMLNLDSLLRRLIGEDIEVMTVPSNDLGSVKADPGQIEQVIMNLALNARDAMPRGGKLTLETANVLLEESYARRHQPAEPGRYVMLAVSDTGHGMSPETQGRIFEPFYTTKEVGKGTGLGLSMVYGIVKQSGGYIWVYSEPDQGTTFKIYLPRVDEPADAAGADNRPKSVQRGTETILLVEDDPQLRQLSSSVLTHCGYKVLVAGGPEEGFELFKANQRDIRLLVTDVVMPRMNGRQLAEQIALISPNIRVLYISGYTSNAIVHYGVLDPGLWFLPKPFSLSALVAKVREVLDSKTNVPQQERHE
jgi:two-component system, cell cycle sensor histidine kinase and response regulator CckA